MIRYLIEKEVRQLLRNRFLPRLIVMMPLMMMLVLPWAANQEVTGLRLCVVDHDHTAASHRLAQGAVGGGYFVPNAAAASWREGVQCIARDEADVVLEIPQHFARRIGRGECPEVYIAANAVNGTRGIIGAAALAQIVAAAGGALYDRPLPTGRRQQVQAVSLRYRFNPHLDYKVYMVPAMMVMLLTLLTGFLPALNIVGEKEQGTIEQINVSPVTRLAFIFSKLLPYWVIGLFVMSLCLGLAALVYGLVPEGSLATVYLLAGIYIIVMSGCGLIISNTSATMQQAVFVMYFFVMVLLLMSGLLTPVRSMPAWAQAVAAFNPLKYFVEAMRAVFLKGSALADLTVQVRALLAFAALFSVAAVWSYRKRD